MPIKKPSLQITIGADRWEKLSALGRPEDVVGLLINHACCGIVSPGTWQRLWLCQAFIDDWPKDDLERQIRQIYSPSVERAVGK